ncbi:CRISPR-associated endonuclease Cas2 [uncultured Psychromonas sp.]|uniref:CRISPR-associated endonuclease Cas2 n=1 Tax=uncultured Psychromonas sp. TaxID=173974 RepID=UPI0026192288|nr:CRISPR-associated endonuclease Cas2 [uncultured Psychromonas sp.]
MPNSKPIWLISYDVSCVKRLRKIHKICSSEGWALQKSVYLFCINKAERLSLCAQLNDILNEKEDRLLCIPFLPNEGSFHNGKSEKWLLIHSDPRLEGYIF